MIHLASQTALSWYWLWHPLEGPGYQFWSGIASDLGEVTLVGAVVALAKHHNCHHKGCLLPGHRHPVHGWPACKKHWHEQPEHTK